MSLSGWPHYPTIYEINTWLWLADLSRAYGTAVDLSSVQGAEWDRLAGLGFDAIWLMGVWERSPAGTAIAKSSTAVREDCARVLPEIHPGDITGSPYCIRRYQVDPHLGGSAGLAIARQELAKRGMRLILDFVPNHVAPDHPWVREHPEFFVRGSKDDLRNQPEAFIEIDGHVFARGKDPYFPPWPDVLQLNAFQPEQRQAAIATIFQIASQCDGIRCDMAMLLLTAVFERTWGARAGNPPAAEYWLDVVPPLKAKHPHFLFIAEVYWNMEWNLQQQGFDYCYDKALYDRLKRGSAETVRLHVQADSSYQGKLLRFIENHDEPRAAAEFPSDRHRAAAVIMVSLPGAKLFYEGQLEGRKIKLPVFLARRPQESLDEELFDFYARLLHAIHKPAFHEGRWMLCSCSGWPDNTSYRNLIASSWVKDEERYLIVVNFSAAAAQGRVQLKWDDATGQAWLLSDDLSRVTYRREGDEMLSPGLYVELAPWAFHFFECRRL